MNSRIFRGGFYYKNFVRQYAAILGVDELVLQPGVDSLLATLNPLPLPGLDPNQLPPLKPVVRKANPSLADPHIGPPLLALIAMLAASGLWYEHSRQSLRATQIMPGPAEQVRPNFQVGGANPELTPAEINAVVAPTVVGGVLGSRQVSVTPAVIQSALKPVKPFVISAPPQPEAKAGLRAAGLQQEQIERGQVVRRVLPEIPVEYRGTIREKATVVVSVVANQSGEVTEASIEESDSTFFARVAMEAAGKWRFVRSKTVSSRQYFLRFETTGTHAEATLQQSVELSRPKEPKAKF